MKYSLKFDSAIAQFILLSVLILLLCSGCNYFFGELSLYQSSMYFLIGICLVLFISYLSSSYNAKDYSLQFIKKHPSIDFTAILTNLHTFEKAVQNQNIKEIQKLISPEKKSLYDDITSCVLGKYYHRFILKRYVVSIKTLDESVTVFNSHTVKVKVNYGHFDDFDEDRLPGEFTHYFIFEKCHDQWMIVDTNFCKRLRAQRTGAIIVAVIFVVGCLLYVFLNKDNILKFLGL